MPDDAMTLEEAREEIRSYEEAKREDPWEPGHCDTLPILALLDAQAAEVGRLREAGDGMAQALRMGMQHARGIPPQSGRAALSRWEEVSGG